MDQTLLNSLIIAALLLGSAGLLILRIIREKRRTTDLRSIYQLADEKEIFLQAEIPQFEEDILKSAGLQTETNPIAGDSFHVLQRNVLWSFPAGTPIRLLVTSPGPGEGRSFVAANLAVALAKVDKRVLLVDANHSRRVLHKWFQLDDGVGLADLVIGLQQKKEFSDQELECVAAKYIQPTKVKNLSLLTGGYGNGLDHAGMLTAAPSAILNDYEVVIVDAPSLEEVWNLRQVPYWHDVLLVSQTGPIQTPIH